MTIVDVEGAGFGIPRNDKEHEESLWELDPLLYLGVISHMEQTSDCAFDGPAYLFRCMTEVDDRDYVHLSEHKLPPLNFQLMKICNNTPHPRQVSRRPCQYWATG